jgi:hypothetical protein
MSYDAATATLKRFFKNDNDKNALSIDQVMAATDRTSYGLDKNKSYLTNKLTHLKYYDLAEPVYDFNPRKNLSGIRLTTLGKKALGRNEAPVPATTQSTTSVAPAPLMTLETIAENIRIFKRQNPSIKITLSVELKSDLDRTLTLFN